MHPEQGFVELSGLPPFDERWRGDPDATRTYRRWMTEERFAFLVVDGAEKTRATAVDGERIVVQRVRMPEGSPVRLGFRGRLDRPALAEITETDPPPPTGARTVLTIDGATLIIRAPELPAEARITVLRRSPSVGPMPVWQRSTSGAELRMGPAGGLEMEIRCSLSTPEIPVAHGSEAGRARRTSPAAPATSRTMQAPERRLRVPAWPHVTPPLYVPARLHRRLGWMTQAWVDYVRRCTALRVADGERTILTDHRILPLSWTRDAYWQALLLLRADPEGEGAGLVAEHLRWLFLRCERPDGAWTRSHHAHGRRKDMAFQVDQQLYPLLELTDLIEATGSAPGLPAGREWPVLVREAWRPVLDAMDDGTALVRTEETPADDPAHWPFLLSVQILLWHTSVRLAAVAGQLGLDGDEFPVVAEGVRGSVERHFPIDGPSGRGWAYAIDASGDGELYHDANDLPIALAPLWGFCPPDDSAWRTTMRFGFSADNPAHVPGPFGGLGSRHTPGTWPLGDIQRWVTASVCGDLGAAEAALDRLVAVATHDGLFPEAYDPVDGRLAARHWFAWPGAALGALILGGGRS